MNVLIINAGSSSLKYQLMNPETGDVSAKGLCERIYIDGRLTHKVGDKKVVKDIPMPTHSEAIQAVLNALVDKDNGVIGSMKEIDAVGHRVVHGGEAFNKSVLITDEVMKALEDCIPLAPLHNPANITGINACTAVMGKDVPQVAVFDTAFHMTMPPKAYRYAIPTEYFKNDDIRRYGFHGTSHKYVTKRAIELMGRKDIKLVNCHLGNGSSLSAVKDGKCQDTSMGLSPLLVKEIFAIIKEVNKQGITILLVEQNAKMALAISDRAYVLETGNITLSGTGAELAKSDEVRKAYLGG